jgi:hypothetical protein
MSRFTSSGRGERRRAPAHHPLRDGEVQELNALRQRARVLRQESFDALIPDVPSADSPRGPRPAPLPVRPGNDMETALVHHCVRLGRAQGLAEKREHAVRTYLQVLRSGLQKVDLTVLDGMCNGEPENGTDSVPTLRAARAFHQLVSQPKSALGGATLHCYYYLLWISHLPGIHEHMIGAATARPGGRSSAFVAGECIRALMAFHASLGRTIDTIAEYRSYLEKLLFVELSGLPRSAASRLVAYHSLDYLARLRKYRARTLIPIAPFECDAFLSTSTAPDYGIDALMLHKPLDRQLKQLMRAASGVERAIADFHAARLRRERGRPVPSAAEDYAHSIAKSNIDTFLDVSRAVHECVKRISKTVGEATPDRWTSAQFSDVVQQWEGIEKLLEENRRGFRGTMVPLRTYLSRALDRELAVDVRGKGGACDYAEMAFAAAGLGASDRDGWSDPRVRRAAMRLLRFLGTRGRIPTGRPFNVLSSGYQVHVIGCEVMRPIARLIQNVGLDVPLGTLRAMIERLEAHSFVPAGTRKRVFTRDEPETEREIKVWAMAIGFLAAARLNDALDAQINRRVLRHFEHVLPSHNDSRLGKMLIADLGLAEEGKRLSTMETLQRMRIGVMGPAQTSASASPQPTAEPLPRSIVLHGPPGTGKTSLIEALAGSSGVPLVFVTPSDILSAGEAMAERRARQVFAQLSMLTRAVILFDEFDSLLFSRSARDKMRKISGAGWQIYDFITPAMLPKLARLYKQSQKQHLAFALATNRLWDLDAAAVREQRFDRHLPVFPPDPLSRATEFLTHVDSADRGLRSWLTEALLHTRGVSAPQVISVARRSRGQQGSALPVKDLRSSSMETTDYEKDLKGAANQESRPAFVDSEVTQWRMLEEMEAAAALGDLARKLAPATPRGGTGEGKRKRKRPRVKHAESATSSARPRRGPRRSGPARSRPRVVSSGSRD